MTDGLFAVSAQTTRYVARGMERRPPTPAPPSPCGDPARSSTRPTDHPPLPLTTGPYTPPPIPAPRRAPSQVPALFREDLLHLAGEHRRPPYKWVVIGPPRSGACLHVDPLSTHAWNALLVGRKRWALYPPEVPKAALLPEGMEREASVWFQEAYPRTRRADWPHVPPLDIIQVRQCEPRKLRQLGRRSCRWVLQCRVVGSQDSPDSTRFPRRAHRAAPWGDHLRSVRLVALRDEPGSHDRSDTELRVLIKLCHLMAVDAQGPPALLGQVARATAEAAPGPVQRRDGNRREGGL